MNDIVNQHNLFTFFAITAGVVSIFQLFEYFVKKYSMANTIVK